MSRYTVQLTLELEVEAEDKQAALKQAEHTDLERWEAVSMEAEKASSHGFGELPDEENHQ